jgi:hypothetical protein
MSNVSEEQLATTDGYEALQAAWTAFEAEAPNTPEKHEAGMEISYCMRDCLVELKNSAAQYLPERPA